ncbi:putative sodium/hydrogen exchanger 6-like [Apostichopus japonicus]|uniref:Putative sodium/hydrogen exchanger 6-like n=1 Tax=Stichopus japonicus TaxID=307972 RepID=A0A2G8L3E6_STIJA|nr:putative sodium/hydrogen exchanger 6-like [Apostichopus japonicus]
MKPILTRKGADLREIWPGWCLPITEYLTVEDDQLEEDSDTDFILEEQEDSQQDPVSSPGPNVTVQEGNTSGEETTAEGDWD